VFSVFFTEIVIYEFAVTQNISYIFTVNQLKHKLSYLEALGFVKMNISMGEISVYIAQQKKTVDAKESQTSPKAAPIAASETASETAFVDAVSSVLRGKLANQQGIVKNANQAISVVQTMQSSSEQILDKLSKACVILEKEVEFEGNVFKDGVDQKEIYKKEITTLTGQANGIAETVVLEGKKMLAIDGEKLDFGENSVKSLDHRIRIDFDSNGMNGSVLEMFREHLIAVSGFSKGLIKVSSKIEKIGIDMAKWLEEEFGFDAVNAGKEPLQASALDAAKATVAAFLKNRQEDINSAPSNLDQILKLLSDD
jgi:hypothetical protein